MRLSKKSKGIARTSHHSRTSPLTLVIAVNCIATLLILSGLLFTYLGSKVEQMRDRIEAILTSTAQEFVCMDNRGLITDCNQGMEYLSGLDKQTLLGKTNADLIDMEIGDRFTAAVTRSKQASPCRW
jgi:PAS domain-containing protein